MKKINTQIKKTFISRYCKHVAIIIALITSFNAIFAQGANTLVYDYYKIVVNAPPVVIPEEVTITGIVKDEAGNPLVNAKVRADYGEELLTDNNGAFSFKLKKEKVIAQSIFVSYASLVTAIRSYHPSMENTSYDITLYKPVVCCKKKKCEGVDFKSFTVFFKNNNSNLSDATKKQLDEMAASIKECPTTNIQLTVHTNKNKSLQRSATIQLNVIKNYLIEQNGISTERITTDEIIDSEGSNSVDVAPQQ